MIFLTTKGGRWLIRPVPSRNNNLKKAEVSGRARPGLNFHKKPVDARDPLDNGKTKSASRRLLSGRAKKTLAKGKCQANT